jgi:hypothetical protein
MTGALDSDRQLALVFGTCAGLATGAYFAIFGDVAPQQFSLLIVNGDAVIRAELADAWLGIKPPWTLLGLGVWILVAQGHLLLVMVMMK